VVSPGRSHAQDNPLASLDWQAGPTKGTLGSIATIDVPEGFRFVGPAGARRFMELTENPSDGSEQGVLLNEDSGWFVVFTFAPIGYVDDKDRDLDANKLLDSIKKGTEESNKTRRERGWATMQILGWQQAPFYDTVTNNLTWSIRGSSSDSNEATINHSTRLLGRRGVMNVDLVLSPDQLTEAVPAFNNLLTGFSYSTGQRYAEFTKGDKIAEYGLAGLIAGGAGVALVKSGLLGKLWKVIVVGFVALLSAIKKMFGGRSRTEAPAQS
jgi:uncharacterized membrane-anchored protein